MSDTNQTKRCPKCKQNKSPSEFQKDRTRKDGLQCYCGQCQNRNRKQYYQQNKTKVLQYQKKSYKKHRTEILQQCLRYRQQHRTENLRYARQHRKTLQGYLYCLFSNMRRRCNNPKDKKYKFYGGRGIKVKFASFDDFFDYVVNVLKADPRGLTIDRIDNDGHYEKGNIRFITHRENCQNRQRKGV